VTQNIDTDESSPTSQCRLHVLAAFAELERGVIQERVISVLRRQKSRENQSVDPGMCSVVTRLPLYALDV